jgi:hypothetical protein
MGDVDPTTVTTHIRAYWAKKKKVLDESQTQDSFPSASPPGTQRGLIAAPRPTHAPTDRHRLGWAFSELEPHKGFIREHHVGYRRVPRVIPLDAEGSVVKLHH